MSAKSFLFAHGEKILVAVVAGGCVYALSGSLSDPSYRPKENAQRIDEINSFIDKVFQQQVPPLVKEPRAYYDQLMARLAESPPVNPTMAWLTVPPDLSKGPKDGPYFYVFELPDPEVTLRDAVGQLEITIALKADENASPARRVSAEIAREWTRPDKGIVTNTAHVLGVCLELRIGSDGDFKPLVLPGATKDGILPLEALEKGPLLYTTSEPWQKHYVRARLVAAATAWDPTDTSIRPKETVLVMPKVVSPDLVADQKLMDELLVEWKKKAGPNLDMALKPETGLALPADAVVAKNEKVFRSPAQPDAKVPGVVVTASVRFALVGLGTDLKDGQSRDIARFIFAKRFVDGEQAKWMDKPVELKYGEGDPLGEKLTVPNPFGDGKIPADLTTPFVVSKLVKGQPRVLYWMIKTKSRQGGGKNKDLELEKKEITTDLVVLKNPVSGNEMTLSKLSRVFPPPQQNVVFFPFRPGPVDERDEFAKDPSAYKQYDLVPTEPVAHEPGTGPLVKLHDQKKDEHAIDAGIYATDTTYYELADHRLVWWDPVNHDVAKFDPDGVEQAADAPKAPTPEAAPTPKVPVPRNKNAPGTPPGMPPGMMPPGMPPGMMPPGGPPMPPHK